MLFLFLKAKNTGCHSQVGRRGGKQFLNLEKIKCFASESGTIIHEFLHSEQSYSIFLYNDFFLLLIYEIAMFCFFSSWILPYAKCVKSWKICENKSEKH